MQQNEKRTREHYIHRLSYTGRERLAGSFVLLAVGFLIWLLISSQQAQNIFEDEITLYGVMTDIRAVDKDTNVIISGLTVGTVSEVNIDDQNHVIITMSILKKYQKLIRTDSEIELLNFKFALVGKSVIEISIGSPSLPVIEDGSTLTIKESLNLVSLLSSFEPTLDTIDNSINKINGILEAIDPALISTNLENLTAISNDLKAITAQLEKGKGLAGSALYDDQLSQDALATAGNVRLLTERSIELSTQVETILARTEVLLKKVEAQVDQIPELTERVKPLLDDADKTLKATQKIWPLSSNIPEQQQRTLTSPNASE